MITVEGFVIVGPISPWDEKHRGAIISDTAPLTFAKTEAMAWRRFLTISPTSSEHPGDFSRKVQFFHDRGYRVRKAKVLIDA